MRVVHCKREPFDVYIGRPGPWGNPFTHLASSLAVYEAESRNDAILKYREWLLSKPALVARAVRELDGKVLGCWCAPKACHGDVLLEVIRMAKNTEVETGTPTSRNVHECVAAVMRIMGTQGITKDSVNESQRFNFRGIDDALNALNAPLVSAGLVIYPTVLSTVRTDRVTKNGGSMTNTVLTVAYRLVSVSDGSETTVTFAGEASDSGDKGVSKALSMSFKYMLFQTFCIPVEGMDDSDSVTPPASIPAKPKAAAKPAASKKAAEEPAEAPEEPEDDAANEEPELTFEDALKALKAVKDADALAELKLTLVQFAKHKDFAKKMKPLFTAKTEEFAEETTEE